KNQSNKQGRTDSPTITTIDITLIETDLEVEIIETEIIIIETEAPLEIEIIVMIEMTTALEVETDLLLGDLATEPPHLTTEMLTILMELLLLLPLPTNLL
ncbi:8907_t:CDS:1, partial [Gigaspora rosea]